MTEPALFNADIPVVVEGQWTRRRRSSDSDQILIKHTEDYEEDDDGDYEEKHPERVEPEAALRESAVNAALGLAGVVLGARRVARRHRSPLMRRASEAAPARAAAHGAAPTPVSCCSAAASLAFSPWSGR